MTDKIKAIINKILIKRDVSPLSTLEPNLSLRNDLGMDSLELAELTVRIEGEFDVDIFEDGIVTTIEDVLKKLSK
jgi:acyl carrier protein